MRYILMLLLCYSITVTKANERNLLFKKIVTGGNQNATLGQVIAGYKKIQDLSHIVMHTLVSEYRDDLLLP